jgi:hypothetical protein
VKRLFPVAALAAACATPELPLSDAGALADLARERPAAILFSVPGCRWCKIAERGFVGASRELPGILFRKVIVEPKNFRALRERYDLGPNMPQARLLLPGGAHKPLPLTREGSAIAAAIREAVGR